MHAHTHESKVIKVTHGRHRRTDNSTLIITRSDRVANRHKDRILMDTRVTQRIRTSMVRDQIFGELELIIQNQRDSHDLLL